MRGSRRRREDGHRRESAVGTAVVSGGTPSYSKLALEQRQQGLLAVRCLIRRTGELENCQLVCSDVPLMEGPVLDKLGNLRMSPPRCADIPFEVDFPRSK
jgi:hypothetical protein